MTTRTDTPTLTLDPVATTLETIDAVLERSEALAIGVARLRQELDDVRSELKLREARTLLAVDGRNETERKAQLALALHGDGDYRRMVEVERTLRQKLSEAEARLWVTQKRFAVCLALLRLAAEAEASADDGAGAMEMEAVP